MGETVTCKVKVISWMTWGFYARDGDVVWHMAAWCPTFFCDFLVQLLKVITYA